MGHPVSGASWGGEAYAAIVHLAAGRSEAVLVQDWALEGFKEWEAYGARLAGAPPPEGDLHAHWLRIRGAEREAVELDETSLALREL